MRAKFSRFLIWVHIFLVFDNLEGCLITPNLCFILPICHVQWEAWVTKENFDLPQPIKYSFLMCFIWFSCLCLCIWVLFNIRYPSTVPSSYLYNLAQCQPTCNMDIFSYKTKVIGHLKFWGFQGLHSIIITDNANLMHCIELLYFNMYVD